MTMEQRLEGIELLDLFVNQGKEGIPLYDELFRYVKSKIRDNHMAEDVMQEIQLQVFKSRDSYNPNERLKPWLYTIATNKCTDYYRKVNGNGKSERPLVFSLNDCVNGSESEIGEFMQDRNVEESYEIAKGNEQEEFVRRAIGKLPDKLKQPMLLVYFQGLKYEEAAGALGIPVGTVKSRLHEARRRLEEDKRLEEYRKAA